MSMPLNNMNQGGYVPSGFGAGYPSAPAHDGYNPGGPPPGNYLLKDKPRSKDRIDRNKHNKANQTLRTLISKRTNNKNYPKDNTYITKPKIRQSACGICHEDHRLLTCYKFRNLSLDEKFKTILKLHYCINCLARSHIMDQCTSKLKCTVCQGKHHTVLHGHDHFLPQDRERVTLREQLNMYNHTRSHPADRDAVTPESVRNLRSHSHNRIIPQSAERDTVKHSFVTNSILSFKQTLIPTAAVNIYYENNVLSVRALINPAKSVTTIASEIAEGLQFPLIHLDSHQLCKIILGSRVDMQLKIEAHALVSDELPRKPYNQDLPESANNAIENILFADPMFVSSAEIMLELGADIFPKIIKSGIISSDNGLVVAQSTAFGWTLTGLCGL